MLLQVTRHRTARPPEPSRGQIERLRVSPDGRKIAYVRVTSPDATLEVASWKGPGPASLVRTWPLGSRRARAVSWAPESDALAVTLGAADPLDAAETIGVVDVSSDALREQPGRTAVWLPHRRGLILAHTDNREIRRWDLDGEEPEPLHQFTGDPVAPALALSPDGSVLVFTTEQAKRSVSEVWTLPLDAAGAPAAAVRLLTQVPGADALIAPFFAPTGLSLGLLVVHPTWHKTGIVVVPDLEGDGEVLYEAAGLDAPIAPAWSATGGALFFFRATPSDDEPAPEGDEAPTETTYELTELDPQSLTMMSLALDSTGPATEPTTSASPPNDVRFLDDGSLVVDGGQEATLLELAPV